MVTNVMNVTHVVDVANNTHVFRKSEPDGFRSEGRAAHVAAFGGLLERAAEWRLAEHQGWETVSTGFQPLDQLLPAGGVRRGSLLELLADGDASAGGDAGGAISLACAVACRLADSKSVGQGTAIATSVSMPSATMTSARASTIVVVDRGAGFYPPAVIPWIDALADGGGKSGGRPQLVVARPSRDEDEIWAIDQALRCPGVAAVLAWPKRVHATAMRRWQLAARTGGAVGLLVRGLCLQGRTHDGHDRQAGSLEAVRREPSWADARVAISPVAGGEAVAELSSRRLRLSLVGGPWSGDAMLEERSVDVLLNLTNGREVVRRHRTPARHGAATAAGSLHADCHAAFPAALHGAFHAALHAEGVACRAS
jgi:hypothetical protein